MIGRKHTPVLLLVAGPSGTGKSTLCRHLRENAPSLVYSVSCTTRAPRGDEVDGVAYHFLDVPTFEARLAAGDFLEHAKVYQNYYGTLRSTVRDSLAAGNDILLEIDVQGARKLRATIATLAPDDPIRRGYVDVFIAPPSLEVLRARLQGRNEDAPEVIERRMQNAELELAEWDQYDYLVNNDELEDSTAALLAIYRAARHRTHHG